ncbi:MarR family transcriptional regulator [Streptomyces sp. ITFR-21]|nr:MarR family transcriptional regulator [Streptomyces sp. ITFR-21]WNI16090.1 MarR family transcriptional regulator [Streptomyces sp. ITFR-21]
MTDVRWLSEEEQRIWRAYLTASVELAAHVDRQLRRDAGLPMAYYEILVRLSEAPDRCLRMSELADASLSSRSRLSHAVAALEKNGWVERRPADADRRGWVCRLTDTGFATLAAAAPGHVTTVREKLFDVLTPEQLETLRDIGMAVSAGLRTDCARAREEDERECGTGAGEPGGAEAGAADGRARGAHIAAGAEGAGDPGVPC